MSAELYNALLESWKGNYEWWKRHHNPELEEFPSERNLSRYDLMRMFTDVRKDRPEWAAVSVNVGRGVICRFDRSRQAFYDRCRRGETPGFPRFKSYRRWRSLEIPDASVSMIVPPREGARWWRLAVKGVPQVRFADQGGRLAAALNNGALAELRVVRTPLRVEVHAVFRLPAVPEPDGDDPSNPVGVDKGLKARLVLSDGTHIPARTADLGAVKRRQRVLSRAKRASRTRAKKRQALTRAWRKETERARHADFRLAHQLVNTYDGIAVEDLNVAGMLRSKLFSRKIAQQRWETLDAILEHKAEKAGVRYVRVNPANTTTDCSACGHRQPMPLRTRVYHCGNCGLVLDRDVNAARNICARAFPKALGREGTTPGVARSTNFCQETDHPQRGGTQADATEQYAQSVNSGI